MEKEANGKNKSTQYLLGLRELAIKQLKIEKKCDERTENAKTNNYWKYQRSPPMKKQDVGKKWTKAERKPVTKK